MVIALAICTSMLYFVYTVSSNPCSAFENAQSLVADMLLILKPSPCHLAVRFGAGIS